MEIELKKVFFCVIYDSSVLNEKLVATLEDCSKALDEIAKGKKMTYIFGNGVIIYSVKDVREIKITHIYFNNTNGDYNEGGKMGLHKFWLQIGEKARIKLLQDNNPSKRKLFKEEGEN